MWTNNINLLHSKLYRPYQNGKSYDYKFDSGITLSSLTISDDQATCRHTDVLSYYPRTGDNGYYGAAPYRVESSINIDNLTSSDYYANLSSSLYGSEIDDEYYIPAFIGSSYQGTKTNNLIVYRMGFDSTNTTPTKEDYTMKDMYGPQVLGFTSVQSVIQDTSLNKNIPHIYIHNLTDEEVPINRIGIYYYFPVLYTSAGTLNQSSIIDSIKTLVINPAVGNNFHSRDITYTTNYPNYYTNLPLLIAHIPIKTLTLKPREVRDIYIYFNK